MKTTKTKKTGKFILCILVSFTLLSLCACGNTSTQTTALESSTETQAAAADNETTAGEKSSEETAHSVETDLKDMTWDEILEEASGQSVTLNVYNADTQVAKYWEKLAEQAKEYNIDVTIVPESSDTDARLISDYENGSAATYDMTWGYYGYAFKPYFDAGCLWGDDGNQWVKYLPNSQYINWEKSTYRYDCGLENNYMESPLMGLTPMLVYSGSSYDSDLAWDETVTDENGNTICGLFHDLTELYNWVQKYPGKFTYLDLTGSGAFHGKCFVKSILYELTDDGNGGWKAVYDPTDDDDTIYKKIEDNAQMWYNWVQSDEATQESFEEKASYVWKYLNDIEPYLMQGDNGAHYGTDAYEMSSLVNAGTLATAFSTVLSISPKLQSDPAYLNEGQAYMLRTSVFAADYMVITKNSSSKAACMVLANLMLEPENQADHFALTGNTYNVDLEKISEEDYDYFQDVFDSMLPGTSPSSEVLANSSHADVCGSIGSWLTDLWTKNVVLK